MKADTKFIGALINNSLRKNFTDFGQIIGHNPGKIQGNFIQKP